MGRCCDVPLSGTASDFQLAAFLLFEGNDVKVDDVLRLAGSCSRRGGTPDGVGGGNYTTHISSFATDGYST